MRLELRKHRWAYIVLIAGLIGLTLLFFAVWPHRGWQRLVIVLMSAYYIGWGLLTHFKTNHITKRVIYEYVGIGVLAGVLLMVITL